MPQLVGAHSGTARRRDHLCVAPRRAAPEATSSGRGRWRTAPAPARTAGTTPQTRCRHFTVCCTSWAQVVATKPDAAAQALNESPEVKVAMETRSSAPLCSWKLLLNRRLTSSTETLSCATFPVVDIRHTAATVMVDASLRKPAVSPLTSALVPTMPSRLSGSNSSAQNRASAAEMSRNMSAPSSRPLWDFVASAWSWPSLELQHPMMITEQSLAKPGHGNAANSKTLRGNSAICANRNKDIQVTSKRVRVRSPKKHWQHTMQ